MLDESLLPRIQAHINRFREIETLLGDPDVMADQQRFVKLTKEYKHLRDLDRLMSAYDEQADNIAFYREVMADESDPAAAAEAHAALDRATAAVDALCEDIKLFLIPADPEDDKNAILEIRAGTGGDEADHIRGVGVLRLRRDGACGGDRSRELVRAVVQRRVVQPDDVGQAPVYQRQRGD